MAVVETEKFAVVIVLDDQAVVPVEQTESLGDAFYGVVGVLLVDV